MVDAVCEKCSSNGVGEPLGTEFSVFSVLVLKHRIKNCSVMHCRFVYSNKKNVMTIFEGK